MKVKFLYDASDHREEEHVAYAYTGWYVHIQCYRLKISIHSKADFRFASGNTNYISLAIVLFIANDFTESLEKYQKPSKSSKTVEILEIDQYTTLRASICVANRSDFENVIA